MSIPIIFDYIGHYGPVILFTLTFYCLLHRIPYLFVFTLGSIANTFLNEFLKKLFREDRPKNQIEFIDDKNLTGAHYYGLPSGHAQASFFALAFLFFANGPAAFIYFMSFICALTLYQRWKYRRHSMKQLLLGAVVGTGVAWILVYLTKYYLHGYKSSFLNI